MDNKYVIYISINDLVVKKTSRVDRYCVDGDTMVNFKKMYLLDTDNVVEALSNAMLIDDQLRPIPRILLI